MIYQQKITRIGSFHLNHCEDYVICTDIGDNRLLLAAMDGCSMGDDSYFAATLCGRLLRKVSKGEFYEAYLQGTQSALDVQLRRVIAKLFDELVSAKDTLLLERNELLTTLLIAIIDVDARQGEVICIGDGVVCIDGELTEYDQDNQPDYLAYHLTEDFARWYPTIKQKISIGHFHDISLSTDGILSFVDAADHAERELMSERLFHYLLVDDTEHGNENGFVKKLHRIKMDWNLIHSDDLGIIRVTFK